MALPDRLPDAAQALVDERKVRDYLLSHAHPIGRGKAHFFAAFGFRVEEWELLQRALREIAETCPVVAQEDTAFATRYIVDGPLLCPDGRRPSVRTIWFREPNGSVPRLVTAYGR